MKNLIIILFAFVIASTAFGLPLERKFRDLKLVTQQLIEWQTIDTPIVGASTSIVTNTAGAISAAIATYVPTVQPDVARTINITPTGTTTDVEACVIVVTGTNIHDATITENFTFLANASTATTGVKAFKTLTLVTFPANCESGTFAATWNIGVTDALGLKRCMKSTGHYVYGTLDGTYEATRATITADADEIEKNTINIDGTLDGAKDVEAFFFQNFACFP